MHGVSRRSIILVLFDVFAIFVAFVFGSHLRWGHGADVFFRFHFVWLAFFIFPFMFYVLDLYHPFKYFRPIQTVVDVIMSVAAGMVACAIVFYADRTFIIPRFLFFHVTLFLIFLVYWGRMVYDYVFKSRILDKRALIVGTGLWAKDVARVIKTTPHSGVKIAGVVATDSKGTGSHEGLETVGKVDDLAQLVRRHHVDLVIPALDASAERAQLEAVEKLLNEKIQVTSSAYLFEKLTGSIPHQFFSGESLLALVAQAETKRYLKLKRLIDLVFGSLMFFVLLPFSVTAILILWITTGSLRNVFFIQTRIGQDGVPFRLLKLRTMRKHPDRKREVTKVGKWLRKYRVDEIPQLVNVLKGDMSLVGPRPEMPYFVRESRKRISLYDTVSALKPGLTGWAQVKFRHTASVGDYEEKFRYDLYYLKNVSPTLDLVILLDSVRTVLFGRGR